jgi:hypothetical protein
MNISPLPRLNYYLQLADVAMRTDDLWTKLRLRREALRTQGNESKARRKQIVETSRRRSVA